MLYFVSFRPVRVQVLECYLAFASLLALTSILCLCAVFRLVMPACGVTSWGAYLAYFLVCGQALIGNV